MKRIKENFSVQISKKGRQREKVEVKKEINHNENVVEKNGDDRSHSQKGSRRVGKGWSDGRK